MKASDHGGEWIMEWTMVVTMVTLKTRYLRTLNQDQFEELLRLSAGNLHISTPSETTTMKPSSSK